MKSQSRESGSSPELILYPPGTILSLLATLGMIVSHTCVLLAIYMLFIMPIPGHETSAGLIMLLGAVSLFLVIHPSFMLTRGRETAFRLLKLLSFVYAVILGLALVWSFFRSGPLMYVAAIGLLTSGVSALLYRGSKMRQFHQHYAALWQHSRASR